MIREKITSSPLFNASLKLPYTYFSFMKIVSVVLSGGSGTRLWPLSRKEYPKQYLPLAGDKYVGLPHCE